VRDQAVDKEAEQVSCPRIIVEEQYVSVAGRPRLTDQTAIEPRDDVLGRRDVIRMARFDEAPLERVECPRSVDVVNS